MIEKESAKKHASALGQMIGFPRDNPYAFAELVLAFEASDTEQIAERVLRGFLDYAEPDTRCPMPKNVRGAVYAIQEPVWSPPFAPEPECEQCGDSGIVGGMLGGPEARWCECEVARDVFSHSPQAVDRANETWRKLTATFGKKTAEGLLGRNRARRKKDEAVASLIEVLSA